MRAIEIIDDIALVDRGKCLGCGLCATGCPNEAMSMRKREDAAAPPESMAEMGLKLLEDKGKTQRFLEKLKP